MGRSQYKIFDDAEKRLTLFAYVILENHLHLVAESDDLSKEISAFKSYTARRIIDLLKEKNAASILWQLNFFKKQHKTDRPYQFWQEGSHPQQIQSEEMMVQKIEYIHYNPVRRGYVEEPRHWRYQLCGLRWIARGDDGVVMI